MPWFAKETRFATASSLLNQTARTKSFRPPAATWPLNEVVQPTFKQLARPEGTIEGTAECGKALRDRRCEFFFLLQLRQLLGRDLHGFRPRIVFLDLLVEALGIKRLVAGLV